MKKRSEEARLDKLRLKGSRCLHCGKTVEEARKRYLTVKNQFELNHVNPAKKHKNYDRLITQKTISTELLDELDKTVLLCVEHHKVLTAQRTTGRVKLDVRLNDLRLKKELTGQALLDFGHNKISFFAEETCYLELYRVKIGDAEPVVRFGETLKADFDRHLLETRVTGQFRVSTYEGKEVFSAVKINDRELEITHSSKFALIPVNITDPEAGDHWLRGGWFISRTGPVSRNGVLNIIAIYPDSVPNQ